MRPETRNNIARILIALGLILIVISFASCSPSGTDERKTNDQPEETTEVTTIYASTPEPPAPAAPVAPAPSEAPEEETAVSVEYDSTVTTTTVVTPELPKTGGGTKTITPEQAENRRIYDERARAYDGTGPTPYQQGQMDWIRENAAKEHAAQSQAVNGGGGEGARRVA